MKFLTLFCALSLLVACFPLPIGYYTFLRIIVSGCAMLIVIKVLRRDANLLGIAFVIMMILFNPIHPIYLYEKSLWLPIDIISALLFLRFQYRDKYKEQ